jgi:hypothetical protein
VGRADDPFERQADQVAEQATSELIRDRAGPEVAARHQSPSLEPMPPPWRSTR